MHPSHSAPWLLALLACSCTLDWTAEPPGGEGSPSGSDDSNSAANTTVVGSGGVFQSEEEAWSGVCPEWVDAGQGGAGGVAGGSAAEAGTSALQRGTGDITVLLVFDKSGSMATPWETGSRWEAASAAFFRGLEGVESQVTVGAIVFPQQTECGVPPLEDSRQIMFQAGTTFAERWQSTFALSEPVGGTPLGLAFARADDAIAKAEHCGLLEGHFRVVVVTDGEPNCGTDPNQLVAYAQKWRDKGVEVHVLGLPGSAAAARLLDRIAGVGGTDEHVATDREEDAETEFWNAVR